MSAELNGHAPQLLVELPGDWVETVAARAAELLAERQAPDPIDTGFLNVAAAAEFLACPASRVYALVSANRIPHHRDGSRLLFDRAELRAYVLEGGAKRP